MISESPRCALYTARGHRVRFFDPIVLPLGRSIRVAASRKNMPVVRECFALTKSAVHARVKYSDGMPRRKAPFGLFHDKPFCSRPSSLHRTFGSLCSQSARANSTVAHFCSAIPLRTASNACSTVRLRIGQPRLIASGSSKRLPAHVRCTPSSCKP